MFGKNDQKPDFEYFAIYDSKADFYREPMLAINRHDMVRLIQSLMSDPAQQRNQLVTNSEDFAIFKVGDYTKKTGLIRGHNPEHVANLHELKASIQRDSGLSALGST